jgi:hypothetical protein
MTESEFEDCLNLSIYKEIIYEKYGVLLDIPVFKNSKKWSDRMKETFKKQGKPWDDNIEKEVKIIVANSVDADPQKSLNPHKQNSIDALVVSIEALLST